jgi:uncharacterized membrane protein YheB (UPF0754 family)
MSEDIVFNDYKDVIEEIFENDFKLEPQAKMNFNPEDENLFLSVYFVNATIDTDKYSKKRLPDDIIELLKVAANKTNKYYYDKYKNEVSRLYNKYFKDLDEGSGENAIEEINSKMTSELKDIVSEEKEDFQELLKDKLNIVSNIEIF